MATRAPPHAVFTRPWWFGVLARIHINSFRVDLPRPIDRDDIAELVEYIDRGSGTAIYTLPSLYNHDCEPNADAAWIDGDATMSITARRNIAAGARAVVILAERPRALGLCGGRCRLSNLFGLSTGEEVRITYIDSMQTLEDRRKCDAVQMSAFFACARGTASCLPLFTSASDDAAIAVVALFPPQRTPLRVWLQLRMHVMPGRGGERQGALTTACPIILQ